MTYTRSVKTIGHLCAALTICGTATANCKHANHAGFHHEHTIPPLSSWNQGYNIDHTPSLPQTTFADGVQSHRLPTNCPTGTTAQINGTCLDTTNSYTANSYIQGVSGQSYTAGERKIIPFSVKKTNQAGYTLPNLKPGESLQPTRCPVNVFNPEGGEVLGCYNVVKTVQKPLPNYHYVMQPVVYVRYSALPTVSRGYRQMNSMCAPALHIRACS
ncbi:MAG: hypothetical protein ACPGVT_10215 [Maricaulaceae bacterium]